MESRSSRGSVDWNIGMNPTILIILVAPLVGAWIEIFAEVCEKYGFPVAPLVGAWIEMLYTGQLKQ